MRKPYKFASPSKEVNIDLSNSYRVGIISVPHGFPDHPIFGLITVVGDQKKMILIM